MIPAVPVPLRPVLERAGDELNRLRELCDLAQDAAGALTAPDPAGVPTAAIVGLQALDPLAQHLSALSGFLRVLAAELSDRLVVDLHAAERELPLEALRARLLGRPPTEVAPAIELF